MTQAPSYISVIQQFALVRNLSYQSQLSNIFLGGTREGEIPVPIPNTEVKPFFADDTSRKSVGK